jgi:hypothetical protein
MSDTINPFYLVNKYQQVIFSEQASYYNTITYEQDKDLVIC